MNDGILYDSDGRAAYQPVLRINPGVLVSVFDADLRQLTGWQPVDDDLTARWPTHSVERRAGARYALLVAGPALRLLDLDTETILDPAMTLNLDLSRVDRAHGPLMRD